MYLTICFEGTTHRSIDSNTINQNTLIKSIEIVTELKVLIFLV